MKVLFEEIVTAWSSENIKVAEMEAVREIGGAALDTLDEVVGPGGPESDFQSATQRMRAKTKRRFISLLDIMEKYQRHGFFTSPGDLIPSFF